MLNEPDRAHISLPQSYGGRAPDARVHRSRPLVPAAPAGLESVFDMLAHVAVCLPRLDALVVWESAIQRGMATVPALRRVAWRGPAPRKLAAVASGRSESLLETVALHRLAEAGIFARQQERLLGHRVDLLIAGTIVVQLDGYAYHSSPADHRRDIEHDARLQSEGFTVLRFDYHQVLGEWDRVLAAIHLALAQGRQDSRGFRGFVRHSPD